MPGNELLCSEIGINPQKLSREERLIVEIELFIRVYEELSEVFKLRYKSYFRLMRFNEEMEKTMLEDNFMQNIINDILQTEEYSLEGIAYYTQTPEEVISDVVAGQNTAPSLPLSRKIINLHRSVRPHLYREIMKKITAEYLVAG